MSRSALAASSLAILAAIVLGASPAAQRPDHPADAKRGGDLRPDQQLNLAIQRELRAPAEIRAEGVPLSQFLETLSKQHTIPFHFDDPGLKRANVKPSLPITAQVKHIPLGVALRRILRQWKLTYRIAEGAVLITDREQSDPPAPVFREKEVQPPPAAINRVHHQQDLDTLLPQLDVELLFVKKICSPTKGQMEKIENDLEKCLRDAGNGSVPDSCDLFPDRLASCVEKHLSNEEQARYRAEVEKRRAHEREACVYTFVTMLDQSTELSEQQRQSLVIALTARWKPEWSQMIELSVRDGDRAFPPVPDHLIARFLNSEQIKLWKKLPKNPDADHGFNAQRIGAVGTPKRKPEND